MSASDGTVLLLDVPAQNRDRCSVGRTGEVRPGPQPSGLSVVLVGRGTPAAACSGYAREAIDRARDSHGGRKFARQVEMVGSAGGLGQVASEVRVSIPMICSICSMWLR